MNELMIFQNPEFGEIRVIEQNGEPWFVAADVCKALDLGNPTQAISRLDEDELTLISNEGGREMNYINEPGLYALVLGSRKKEAKTFKRWITHEVVPSIRKHGAYMTEDTLDKMILSPDFGIKLLTALKDEQDKRKALEAENEKQRQVIADFEPIRQYLDVILSSTGTMATSQIAADYDITARTLNKILHEEGVQRSVNGQWILYQRHMGKGYTKSETIPITRSDGSPDTKLFTRWTQKGRLMIHEILTKRGIQAVMDRKAAG